jgi:hypothetical protein
MFDIRPQAQWKSDFRRLISVLGLLIERHTTVGTAKSDACRGKRAAAATPAAPRWGQHPRAKIGAKGNGHRRPKEHLSHAHASSPFGCKGLKVPPVTTHDRSVPTRRLCHRPILLTA